MKKVNLHPRLNADLRFWVEQLLEEAVDNVQSGAVRRYFNFDTNVEVQVWDAVTLAGEL